MRWNGVSLQEQVTVNLWNGDECRIAVSQILQMIDAADPLIQREVVDTLRLLDLMNGHILHYLQVVAVRHSHSSLTAGEGG